MKKQLPFFCLLVFLLFSSTVYSQDISKLDEKYGFRDAKFETHISKFDNLEFLLTKGDVKFYRRTTDVHQIGEFDISIIMYSFYNEKLHGVQLKTNGYKNTKGLIETLKAAYGECLVVDDDKELLKSEGEKAYLWFSKKVSLFVIENTKTEEATATFHCNALVEEREAADAAAAAKAVKDM
ncbi:hypothetical protein [Pontibacter pamirensis]|uniref:hypothetical protein n=1 Tax=Pontibacter pamirensis TaxID=2562824 RepID=UPI00138A61B5|nr:hypothetical protein [Pontibacter pamirensis]